MSSAKQFSFQTVVGSEFQVSGADAGKLRFPYLIVLNRGSTRSPAAVINVIYAHSACMSEPFAPATVFLDRNVN